MRSILRLALLLALLLPGGAAAQLYQWEDAEGRLHFSDVPPQAARGEAVVRSDLAADEDAPPADRGGEALAPTHAAPDAPRTWTLPLGLPRGDTTFGLTLPGTWTPLEPAELAVFEDAAREQGAGIAFSSGFTAGEGRFLLVAFTPAAHLAGAVARLPRLPRGWRGPGALPEGPQVFDAERGVVWQRNPQPAGEVVSALAVLEEGKLDLTLVTPHATWEEDLDALAAATAALELPRGEGPQALAERIDAVREARGRIAGVGAGVLLVVAWALLGRVRRAGPRGVLRGGAILAAFGLIVALGATWGADAAKGGEAWFTTLLVLGIPLEWWSRRRRRRAATTARTPAAARA